MISSELVDQLSGDTLTFAVDLAGPFEQPDEDTLKSYQLRYLHSMAVGSIESATAYWTLRAGGFYKDYNCIARSLMERTINATLAAAKVEKGAELIASELNEQIKSIKKWISASARPLETLKLKLLDYEDQLRHFLELVPSVNFGLNKSIFNRFKEANLETTYRSAYFHLCSYVHASYLTPFEENGISPGSDFFALVAPLECSYRLHCAVGCKESKCGIGGKFNALRAQVVSILEQSRK